MSEILNENIEPKIEIKKKKIMSDKQKEALKKGRETAMLRARERKLEKEKLNKQSLPEPISKELEVIEEILEQPEETLEEAGQTLEEITEEDKPQPLLKQNKKKVHIKEEVEEIKQSPKERLAQMRLQKRLELEEKKLQLEELKLNKLIEEENKKIESLKTIKQHEQVGSTEDIIFARKTPYRSFGRRGAQRHF